MKNPLLRYKILLKLNQIKIKKATKQFLIMITFYIWEKHSVKLF